MEDNKNLIELQNRVNTYKGMLDDYDAVQDFLEKKNYKRIYSGLHLTKGDIERKLKLANSALTVYEYLLEKLGSDTVKLGSYLEIRFQLATDMIVCHPTFTDEVIKKLEEKFCEEAFYEYRLKYFVREHLLKVLSPILGSHDTYSRLGGSDGSDLIDVVQAFERLGYLDFDKEILCGRQADFDNNIQGLKATIDWFDRISKDERLMGLIVDKLISAFIEGVASQPED